MSMVNKQKITETEMSENCPECGFILEQDEQEFDTSVCYKCGLGWETCEPQAIDDHYMGVSNDE